MTAAEKQKTAFFLDLTGDFLASGYLVHAESPEHEKYRFEDDKTPPPQRQKEEKMPQNAQNHLESLELIAQEVKSCDKCSLCKNRTNAAPGEGVQNPLVLVIGEGPGEEEDRQGRPFVGRAGQLLDKMLGAIELCRNTNCFIANVVKCRPPGNRDPHPEEIAACASFLERQINLLRPKYILVVGRVAAQALLKTTEPVGKLRGKFTEFAVANPDSSSGSVSIPLIITGEIIPFVL
jgi:DNA polymerase